MSDDDHRLRNRLLPGVVLLDDQQTWSPVVPRDINAAPPKISAQSQFSLADLEITAHGYRCAACARSSLVQPLPANLKVGRGRWWIMPIVFAVGGAFVLVAPAVALIVTLVGAALAFQFFIRRGL